MQTISFPQGSPEWLAALLGMATASKFADAVKATKTGRAAVSTDYAGQLAYERVMGEPAEIVFQNAAMKRGTELEPKARSWYESKTGDLVETAGLLVTECGRFGYSPDGLVGTDGLIEIKCPLGKQFVSVITSDDASDYMHQIQGGLWITGRQWCDLVIYTDAHDGQGYIQRIQRDEVFIAKLAAELVTFDLYVAELVTIITTKIGA